MSFHEAFNFDILALTQHGLLANHFFQQSCESCASISCEGRTVCQGKCTKECQTAVCKSPKCSFVCEPGSTCSNVECSSGVNDCYLDCQNRATCNLTCSSRSKCTHNCALNGFCQTKVDGFLDIHNGKCGLCNCTRDVRNCVQRCESANGRCLGLYCDASSKCVQYSKSKEKSFVLYMLSTAPNGRQVTSCAVLQNHSCL